ncbi:ribbon-helix-helix protein, CopG family [Paracoccus yeei]|uniref:ribbon-helix-helix protein, CopG family n=1 Tax=Paracoccus yeei TaxID=147645 RepID=UPI0020C27EA7|nr:ribbon-helix-helix protein, CopG family [Paracoccus yeei]
MPDYMILKNQKTSPDLTTLEKKTRGRPSVDSEAINLRLPRELIEAIDDRRRVEPDLPTRPEMIRRALVQWLEMTQGKS